MILRATKRPWLATGLLAPVLTVVIAAQATAQVEPLERARRLYNQGKYDAAIEAANEARGVQEVRHIAALLQGRALLERFRQTDDPMDLTAAREALRSVDVEALPLRDQADLMIGLAEALYLDRAYRSAADLFGSALDRPDVQKREQVLDWWATALDRHAQTRPPGEAYAIYDQIAGRMRDELKRDSTSAPASYWLVVCARAQGDLDLAWDAAIAAWVRAQLSRDRGAAIRSDLDRLVTTAIIPERARRQTAGASDGQLDQAIAGMLAEWEQLKSKWAR